MKKGFLNFGTLAILGLICLAVAATLVFNTILVKNKGEQTPTPTPKAQSVE